MKLRHLSVLAVVLTACWNPPPADCDPDVEECEVEQSEESAGAFSCADVDVLAVEYLRGELTESAPSHCYRFRLEKDGFLAVARGADPATVAPSLHVYMDDGDQLISEQDIIRRWFSGGGDETLELPLPVGSYTMVINPDYHLGRYEFAVVASYVVPDEPKADPPAHPRDKPTPLTPDGRVVGGYVGGLDLTDLYELDVRLGEEFVLEAEVVSSSDYVWGLAFEVVYDSDEDGFLGDVDRRQRMLPLDGGLALLIPSSARSRSRHRALTHSGRRRLRRTVSPTRTGWSFGALAGGEVT